MGRPKGSRNKVPYEVRVHVVEVLRMLQDPEVELYLAGLPKSALLYQAYQDPKWFYSTVIPKLLPKETTISGGNNPIEIILRDLTE